MRRAVLICALALLWGAAPAHAATNACNFSVDDYWTSIDVTVTGTPDPAAGLDPGAAVRLEGVTAAATLPAYLASTGYNTGLLKAGRNEIPVKVWVAVQATNTVERTQLLGPVSVQAETTITTDASGAFVSATPITYAPPALPVTTWTAVGGDIVFSQAPAGSITQRLPIGPNDVLRSVTGSAVILADLSPARFSMDCRPGRGNATGTGPVDEAPVTVATAAVPMNQTCEDRSFAQATITGPALGYTAGQPFTLSGVRVAGVDAGSLTIRGAGTVEGTRVAAITGGVVADTTWTPSGTGPITFTQAPGLGGLTVGALRCVAGFLQLDGTVVDNPAPPVFATATIPPPPPPPPPPVVVVEQPGPVVTPAPSPTPQPKTGKVSVRSKRLALTRGKVKLQLACSKAGPCTGRLNVLKTAKRYSIAAGKTKTYTLSLKTKAKRVKVTLTPATGARVSKTLAVKRG